MTLPTWTLQDRLRKAREHAGLTQGELADRIPVARNTLTRWESGERNPSTKSLQALAEATGVPVDWFYQEDAAQPPAESPNMLPPGSTVTWTPDGLKVSP